MPEEKKYAPLNRGILKWDLVLMIINSIIGAGIFGLPSKIFALSGTYSLLAFGVCALVVMVFILCFAEVSSQFDETGGPYIYILTAFGRFPAFIMGWLLILSRVFNYATLINLLVIYLSYFSEAVNTPLIRMGCILFITALLGCINHIGVKSSTRISNVLTVAKLVPLTAFIFIGLLHIEPELLTATKPLQLSSFTTSVLLLIFAFGGFESMLINSGEVDKAQKNIPSALIISAVIVAIYYCLIQLVSIGTLPALATSEKPLAEAAGRFMGPWGGNMIAAGAIISIIGTLNVILLSASRLPFALSTEKQLPAIFTYVHPRHRTPTWSLMAMSVIIAIVSLVWSFFTALAVASIIRVLVYLIVCACMLRLRKKQHQKTYFKIRYGYFFALAGIIFSIWLLSASKWNEIRNVSVCVIAGVVLYVVFMKFKKFQSKEGNENK
jgi:amino acid transporter